MYHQIKLFQIYLVKITKSNKEKNFYHSREQHLLHACQEVSSNSTKTVKYLTAHLQHIMSFGV